MTKAPITLIATVAIATAAMAQTDPQPIGSLAADGNTPDTYSLIRRQGYNYETPDRSRDHATAPFQHIRQAYDQQLGKPVFVFYIHAAIDDDRGKANISDRQRNELKTDAKSPSQLVAQQGETMTLQWKFKLPKGFTTTKKFTHIHQLKGLDNSDHTAQVGAPLITFTCYNKGNGRETLELRYDDRTTGQGQQTVARAPLDEFKNEWVSVSERVKFGADGAYEVDIRRVSDGKLLLHHKMTGVDLWRTDCAGMRPKWGIYRYLGPNRSMQSLLRDEELRFADFDIRKE